MTPQRFVVAIGLVGSLLTIAGYSLRDIAAAPTITEFSLEASGPYPGERATLRWAVADAESVTIEPDIGTVGASGTHQIVISGPRTYTLIARNGAGDSTTPLPITPVEPPIPTVQISITPTPQLRGENITLDWATKDADTVVIAGIGEVPTTGSRQVVAEESRTYEITASNRFKKTTAARADVAVQDWPLPTISLRAAPNPVVKGREILVRWETTFAKRVIVEPFGNVTVSGEKSLVVDSSFALSAQAIGPGGSATAELRVEAIPALIVEIPRNQELRVRLVRPLGSAISQVEEQFDATLARELRIRGVTVASANASAWGTVASVAAPGRVRGRASIGLILERLTLTDGSIMQLETNVEERDQSSLGSDLLRTLITTSVGAAAGGAVGGAKGAATGAAGGAAAGAGASLLERGDEVVLPAGFEIRFRTRSAQTVELARPAGSPR